MGNKCFKIQGYLALAISLSVSVCAQDSTGAKYKQWQQQYITAVNGKAASFNGHMEKYTGKALERIIKQEKKMQAKMARIDPAKAKQLFTYSIDSLGKLESAIKSKTGKIGRLLGGNYFPYLDTLKQSLGFLKKGRAALDGAAGAKSKLNASFGSVEEMESKLATADKINEYLQQREAVLQSQLSSFPQLSGNLKKINKEAWYYQAQVNEYKNTLQDETKIEKLALSTLGKITAFQKFAQQNSELAGIFASPGSFSDVSGGGNSFPIVNGLPSRTAVQQAIRNAVPGTGAAASMDPAQLLQQQIGNAGAQLDNLKNKLNGLGGMGNQTMPDFTPNTQHTRSFVKRLEYGTDLQFGKSVRYIPATATVGIKVGYKLNDKASAGVGASYILGLGNGWNHIRFSNEGLGLRTYIKWRLIKGLDIQGGSEWNYMLRFNSIEELKTVKAWQQSALLGLSKNYKVGKKIKGSFQVLYDFLYHSHLPVTQPVVFRVGYGF